ncbi:tripartite tricarboxylate transporter substrate-binding protein [Roseomonas sp. BN140053]|uniref:tripartite tricarboxylate transporter substrate-binding protein n=1 Tax=Roseomonas sp. BN140053 TaxID=3391898 RepID=UPI0039E84137
MKRLLMALGALWLLVQPGSASAAYPDRAITVVLPLAAGGPADAVARVLGEAMSRDLGRPIVIQNITGAGGTIGIATAARAAPDGYTLLLHHIALATTASLYRQLPYDPRGAFAPVGLITELPLAVFARQNLGADDPRGLIELLRTRTPPLSMANAGLGSASHLCGLLLLDRLPGARIAEVGYRGTAPAMNDVVSGQVDLLCDSPTRGTVGLVETGRVRPIFAVGRERLSILPDTPSTAEIGVQGFDLGIWHALQAPRGTPEPVIARLVTALQAGLRDEQVVARLADMGTRPFPPEQVTPEAVRTLVDSEITRWGNIIRAAGIQPE